MKYKNPPIVEAICEIRFSEDTRWDNTIPGLLYSGIRNQFPIKKQRFNNEVVINQKNDGEIEHQVINSVIAQFFSEDEKFLVQVGERLLTINHIAPYTGWEKFFPLIENVFNVLINELEYCKISRIGLRFINNVKSQSHTLNSIKEYLTIFPEYNKNLSKNILSFITGLTFDISETNRSNIRVNSLPSDKGFINLVLDIDYFTKPTTVILGNGVLSWIQDGHNQVVRIFEESITENSRKIFEVMNNDS